ncbi:MAG: hypothetical protein EP343_25455 [Deltaproteobacteria bacterium]|nr:MAG: hypothetical protein EP343_25455 [Deltaproteobacteria bacterium]
MKLLSQLALACFALGCFASQATAKRTCKISVYAGMTGHRKTASFSRKVGGFARRPKKQCIALARVRHFTTIHKNFITSKILPKNNQYCKSNPSISFVVSSYLYRRRKPFQVTRIHHKPKRYHTFFKCYGYKDCKRGPCAKWKQYKHSDKLFYCVAYYDKKKRRHGCMQKFLKKDYRWVNHGAR